MRPTWIVLAMLLGAASASHSRLASAAPSGPDVRQESREHYEKGLAHYNLGEFPGAIEEFKRAYEISKAPKLLFNLAQAQRLNKEYEEALYSYTTYLRLVPDAANRIDVTARVAEMSRLLKEQREHAPAAPEPPTVPATPVPVVAPPPQAPVPTPSPAAIRHPSRAPLYAGIGVAAGGLALLGAAAGCTAAASSAGDQLRGLVSMHGMWDAHYQSLYDDGQRNQAAAAAMWAIGGAAVVAGGIVAIVGARRARQIRVGAMPGAAAIAWSTGW